MPNSNHVQDSRDEEILPLFKAIKTIRLRPVVARTDRFYAREKTNQKYRVYKYKKMLLTRLAKYQDAIDHEFEIGALARIPKKDSPTMLDLSNHEPYVVQDAKHGGFDPMSESRYFQYGDDFEKFLKTRTFWKKTSFGSYIIPRDAEQLRKIIENVEVEES